MVQGFQRIHSHIATVSTHRRESDACRLYGHLDIAKPFLIMCYIIISTCKTDTPQSTGANIKIVLDFRLLKYIKNTSA